MKDEEYVRALKQQSEDIETLLDRMSQQFKEMQEEYEVELEQIEDAFLKVNKIHPRYYTKLAFVS